MKLGKAKNAEMHQAIEGFEGGLWEHDGKRYIVVTTHGWAMRLPDGKWSVPVAYSAQEPEAGEPHTYVVDRGYFLANFKQVDAQA